MIREVRHVFRNVPTLATVLFVIAASRADSALALGPRNVGLSVLGAEIEASDSLGGDTSDKLIDGVINHTLEHRWHSAINKPQPHWRKLHFPKALPLRRVLFHASAVYCFPTHVFIECQSADGEVQSLADTQLTPAQTVGVDLPDVTADNLSIRILDSSSGTNGYVQLSALEVLASVTPDEARKLAKLAASPASETGMAGETGIAGGPSEEERIQRQNVKIQADRPGVKISPMLYGIFFEELSHVGDGGLYAEMVRNRDFESVQLPVGARIENKCLITPWFQFNQNDELYPRGEGSDLPWWSAVAGGGARVNIALDRTEPLHANNPLSMRVEVQAVGSRAGVANEGYWGMSVRAGEWYDLTFYARTVGDYPGKVAVILESADGKRVYAKATVGGISGGWKKYHCGLQAGGVDPKARLTLTFSEPGTVWLDIVSLFPRHTYKARPNGMRADIAQMLAALHPAFLRFPGGGYANGISTVDRFQWNKTIGDLPQRPGNWNRWGYHVTTGMGYHEYLQFCEDIGAEPIFVAWPGVSAGAGDFAVGKEAVQPYVQEMLDAVEYANGPPDSKWGAERVKNGHRRPFHLKYVEIGNEDSGPAYIKNFKIMSAALKARHPEILTIATCPVGDAQVDILDDHWYGLTGRHFGVSHVYDRHDRQGPKIFVGEYAGSPDGIQAAVAEAADLIGFERNGDLVTMACYAPLLVNVNRPDWAPNLIYFDNARCYGRSSYYAQKMFSLNRPDFTLQTQVAGDDAPVRPGGLIGLGCWDAAAEFKNLHVAKNGQILFAPDSTLPMGGFKAGKDGGKWVFTNGVVRQAERQGYSYQMAGKSNWSDYTLTAKARIIDGDGRLFIAFRSDETGEGFQIRWHLEVRGNSYVENYGVEMRGLEAKPFKFEKGRWYDMRVDLKGAEVKCFLDGQLMHTATVEQLRVPRFFATSGWDEKRRQLVIKMANAMDTPLTASLKIEGLKKLASTAEVITLSAARPAEENSFEQPTKIVPVTSWIEGFGKEYDLLMRPWSIVILRADAVKETNLRSGS